jgi:inner membrane protease subunit 1
MSALLQRLVRVQRPPLSFAMRRFSSSAETGWAVAHLAKRFVQGIAIGYVLYENIGGFIVCSGPSMEPTLPRERNLLFIDRFSSPLTFATGDVVLAESVVEPTKIVCKRIVGLPGDHVSWQDVDDYVGTVIETKTAWVPRGHVWLQGDNPRESRDSRDYGAVPIAALRGRVVGMVLPLPDAHWITATTAPAQRNLQAALATHIPRSSTAFNDVYRRFEEELRSSSRYQEKEGQGEEGGRGEGLGDGD